MRHQVARRAVHGCARSGLVLLAALTAGCGGGAGGNGNGGGEPVAYHFTATTAAQGAGTVKAAIAVLPKVTSVTLHLLDHVTPSGARDALDICTRGTARLDWDDADGDALPSAGDTFTVALTGCEVGGDSAADGTAIFSVTGMGVEGVSIAVSLDLTVADVADVAASTRLTGDFTLAVGTPDTNQMVFHYGTPPSGGYLRAVRDGQTVYSLGCFDVVTTFSPATPEQFTLVASGNLNTGASGVIGLFPYGGAPLTFAAGPDGSYPESGQIELLGQAISAPCEGAGIPEGGITPGDTQVQLVATGGGAIVLHGTDSSGAPLFEVSTTWSALE